MDFDLWTNQGFSDYLQLFLAVQAGPKVLFQLFDLLNEPLTRATVQS